MSSTGVMLMITDSLAGDRLIIEGGIVTAILGGMVMAAVSIVLEAVPEARRLLQASRRGIHCL